RLVRVDDGRVQEANTSGEEPTVGVAHFLRARDGRYAVLTGTMLGRDSLAGDAPRIEVGADRSKPVEVFVRERRALLDVEAIGWPKDLSATLVTALGERTFQPQSEDKGTVEMPAEGRAVVRVE